MTKQNKGQFRENDPRTKEAASKGGKAAHARGTAHKWDSQEAAEAGKKGGSE